ncbi:hypothetical protein [Natranaerofaba carboxydovora]|uniref:restriction endonuclease-related protein n=1 Tax=Natranaerofaba carboxydovora TaxID=2742683 RepID=UPI001F138238|nr:hypothetical protein [Natranaerofaba carboxydovora]UMZ73722.1 hypothetical protein ACONDI_01288 [Natranaerofaba carboxydovora]
MDTTAFNKDFPEKIISYLATGFVKWDFKLCEENKFYPYPEEIKVGWDRLAAYCINHSISFPENLKDLLEFFHKPISNWGILDDKKIFSDEALLEDGIPTETCNQLAVQTGDIEAELTQRLLLKVRDVCNLEDAPIDYVIFREFIIKHPTIKKKKLIDFKNNPDSGCAAEYISEAYEDIPASAFFNGKVYKCSNCGWIIEWKNNRPACDSNLCSYYTNQFNDPEPEVLETPKMYQRLKRGIQRFIARPGRWELELANKLQKLNLKIELWPDFDKYDLRITFPDETVWAVDVKDWSNPYLLAKNATIPDTPYWDKAFIVVPKYRKDSFPNYKQIFINHSNNQTGVSFDFDNEFIKRVKELGKEGN